MIAKHTPGPWEVESPMPDELWIVEANKQAYEWRVVAASPFPDERGDIPRAQVEANTRLMAASPDMISALIDLKPILNSAESNASGNPEWEAVSKRINAARAAIAKALGQ